MSVTERDPARPETARRAPPKPAEPEPEAALNAHVPVPARWPPVRRLHDDRFRPAPVQSNPVRLDARHGPPARLADQMGPYSARQQTPTISTMPTPD
jgi:hypothetical protein